MKTARLARLYLLLPLAFALAAPQARAFEVNDFLQAQGRDPGREVITPLAPVAPRERNLRGQNRARDAVRRGEILSLEEVARRVQGRYPGRLLDVRLDESGRRPIYYLKMLTRDGRVMNLAVDARTAQVLGTTGR
jgi:hypothetical protein